MLGLRSPKRFGISLAVISLILWTASGSGAQTPTTAVEKTAPELSLLPLPDAKVPAAPTASKEEAFKATAETAKTDAVPESVARPVAETATAPPAPMMQTCPAGTRVVNANVVAIPKAIMLNRLGATIPNAFVFALKSDTISSGTALQLRPGKRPRPIVLRANVGDCLRVTFTNTIPPAAFANSTPNSPAVGTTEVSLHIQGQEWASASSDDGSFVGENSSSLASPAPAPTPPPMPPQTMIYTLFVKNEGTFLLYTMGDTEAEPTGQLSRGLFGALNVQPTGAEWYRSQVTQQDLALATRK